MMTKAVRFIAIAMLAGCGLAAAPSSPDVTGNWKGTIDAGTVKLRLLFKVAKVNEQFTARMDSLDQGVRNIPVDKVSVQNGTLHMEVDLLKAVYNGKLDASGSKAAGEWQQGGQTLTLNLERVSGEVSATLEPEAISPADLPASKQAAEKLAGVWSGSLHVPTASLRLRVVITNTPAGTATGTLDSLDQGANGIPLSGITLKEDKVKFEAKGFAASYEGTLSKDKTSIQGDWRQAGQSIPLELKKAASK